MTAGTPGLILPRPLQGWIERSSAAFLQPGDAPPFDFRHPPGEPALASPDSVAWQIFKNPLALFIGGVAAVILELAEPRVCAGVWEHTTFRTDPVRRLQRTGLAAMVTVYGARSAAEAMIAGVGRAHARVGGRLPDGTPYRADDPALLDWVQLTSSYGFLEAYCAFVRPLPPGDRDRFLAETVPAARLYGAFGAPATAAAMAAGLAAMRPRLKRSDTVPEFLGIMARAPVLPRGLRAVQGMMVRAAVETVPAWAREDLGLDEGWRLRPWEGRLLRAGGALADRLVVRGSPAVEACARLGLPADYLYAAGGIVGANPEKPVRPPI